MSVWGPGPLQNDDGADWFADIRDEPSLKMIRQAIEEISDPQHVGYFEVTEGAEAVAAARVLAESLGSPGDEQVLDEELEEVAQTLKAELTKEGRRDIAKLVRQAINVLEIVLNDREKSELRQMWEEQVEVMPEWIAAMSSLQRRLRMLAV